MGSKIAYLEFILPCNAVAPIYISDTIEPSPDDPIIKMSVERMSRKYKDHCDICIKGERKMMMTFGYKDVEDES